MKKFTQNSIVQKIIIALIFVILFEFCAPSYTRAATDITEPISEFVLFLADGILSIMQGSLLGNSTVTIEYREDSQFEKALKTAGGITRRSFD